MRSSLKEDFVSKKIVEMIESELRGSRLEEEEKVQAEIQVDSQTAFWIAFLKRCKATNTITNFKFFLHILLVLPANFAGLERMFKSLKAMKSKVRNRMNDTTTKKLIMILKFCDEIEFDLTAAVKNFKKLRNLLLKSECQE